MTEGIFLRLSDKYALGADDLQWIVYRSRRAVPSPIGASLRCGRCSEWEPVSFVRSTKEILLCCCGPVTCDEAQLALEGYPRTFDAWKATHSAPSQALSGVPEAVYTPAEWAGEIPVVAGHRKATAAQGGSRPKLQKELAVWTMMRKTL